MRKFFLFTIFIFTVHFANSQIDYFEGKDNQKDSSLTILRPYFGGEFSLLLGTFTNVSLSPKIAYPITSFFNTGVGVDFMYSVFQKESEFLYGGNVFTDLYLLKLLDIHLEYQILNVVNYQNYPYTRAWKQAYYAGLGYRQDIADHMFINYSVLWDFNYSILSPYSNPTYRITFYF